MIRKSKTNKTLDFYHRAFWSIADSKGKVGRVSAAAEKLDIDPNNARIAAINLVKKGLARRVRLDLYVSDPDILLIPTKGSGRPVTEVEPDFYVPQIGEL